MLISESLLLLLANFLVLAIALMLAKNLMLTFNRQLFFILADIFAYISYQFKGKKDIFLNINTVEQEAKIFNLESAFANNLITSLKKK